jgi:hypothetical protein
MAAVSHRDLQARHGHMNFKIARLVAGEHYNVRRVQLNITHEAIVPITLKDATLVV